MLAVFRDDNMLRFDNRDVEAIWNIFKETLPIKKDKHVPSISAVTSTSATWSKWLNEPPKIINVKKNINARLGMLMTNFFLYRIIVLYLLGVEFCLPKQRYATTKKKRTKKKKIKIKKERGIKLTSDGRVSHQQYCKYLSSLLHIKKCMYLGSFYTGRFEVL